jgi:hypothetical protein
VREEHQTLSLRAALESITLLKNDGILPLSKNSKILVAGLRSNDIESLAGGWTGYPQPGITIMEAIRSKITSEGQILQVLSDVSEAQNLAAQSDVAIAVVGEEQYIHTSPWGPEQLSLIKAIHETGTPTIVVILMARPYIIPWCAENASAILSIYQPGTRGGEATAEVLFGDYNPIGKLPFQIPRSMEQVEAQHEDIPFDIDDPLYDYGHGLSYKSLTSIQPGDSKFTTWGKVKKNSLLQNYPNPFNPDTWIPYQLAEDADVTIRIYDISTRLIRTLNLGRKPAGSYADMSKAAHWDGKNEEGEKVSSGIYFYTIQAGEFRATRKMVMAK